MISYLIEITLLMKLKNNKNKNGDENKDDDDGKKQRANRLSELKLILDKYRPMEKKLQYQIDKILSQQQTSGSTTFEENALFGHNDDENNDTIDPSLLKPNPESMLGATTTSKETQEGEKQKKKSVYRAPRLTSIHFQQNNNNNESEKEKELKIKQKQRKQMEQSELLATLKHQYTDTPEEDDYQGGAANTSIGATAKWKKYHEKVKDKTKFEEQNMTRLITTNKDKKERNEMLRSNENNLYSLTDLGNLSSGINAFQRSKSRDKDKRRADNDKDEHIFVDDLKNKIKKNEKSRGYKNSLQRDLFDDKSGKKNKKQRRRT